MILVEFYECVYKHAAYVEFWNSYFIDIFLEIGLVDVFICVSIEQRILSM